MRRKNLSNRSVSLSPLSVLFVRAAWDRSPSARGGVLLVAFLAVCFTSPLCATELVLKDGRMLHGKLGMTSAVEERPKPVGQGYLQPILFLDDKLRRTFIAKRLVRPDGVVEGDETPLEKFRIWQKPRYEGNEILWIGAVTKSQPFDKFGRRTLTIRGAGGDVDVFQGITDLTPQWGKVRGISHVWDMRISPSSIPSETLYEILKRQPHSSKIDHQKKIALFFIQMERYEDAVKVLEKLVKDHPKSREDIELSLKQLRRLSSERLLRELKLRSEAGQHQLVWDLVQRFLEQYPVETISGEVLQQVREMTSECEAAFTLQKKLLARYEELTEKIAGEEDKKLLQAIGKELQAELNQNTLRRMAAFRLALDDKEMAPSEKLALAVSGWVLGSNSAIADLTAAISAYEIREMVRAYLLEKDEKVRTRLLGEFSSKQAATPKLVDQILKQMKPPAVSTPVEGKSGYFELEIDGLTKDTKVPYVVQLPPEYDPYKSYPTIVALHGKGVTPEGEVTWWAGDWTKKGTRHGQATRQGYIVIAPAWMGENQKRYEYSASAHANVTWTLRDAKRRFSIDTNRVFLTGHSIGAEAAWDIGLAHPDLWAGVIPIAPWADRYIRYYWENAKRVPFYFVGGQLDGNWMEDNSQQFNRYLSRGYNTTVVEYLGRGHEHFHDEILRMFEWMSHFKRDFYPREINYVSMRPWDNSFWWIELSELPQATMVNPEKWPPRRGTIPMRTKAKVLPTNGLSVKTGASHTTIWLSPELVDFDRPIPITVNGRRVTRRNESISPSVRVMLEDARTRCDRHNAFWARVETE